MSALKIQKIRITSFCNAIFLSAFLAQGAIASERCSGLFRGPTTFTASAKVKALQAEATSYTQAISDQDELLAMLANPGGFSAPRKFVGLVDGVQFIPPEARARMPLFQEIAEFVINPVEQTFRLYGRYKSGEAGDAIVSFEHIFGSGGPEEKRRLIEVWKDYNSNLPRTYEDHLVYEVSFRRKKFENYFRYKFSEINLEEFVLAENPVDAGFLSTYHFTKSVKTRDEILKNGFNFEISGGMGGVGIYGVRGKDIKRTAKWASSHHWVETQLPSTVLLEVKLKRSSRILNTAGDGLGLKFYAATKKIRTDFLDRFESKYSKRLPLAKREKIRSEILYGYAASPDLLRTLPDLVDCDAVIYHWSENEIPAIVIKRADAIESIGRAISQ